MTVNTAYIRGVKSKERISGAIRHEIKENGKNRQKGINITTTTSQAQ